MGAGLNGPPVVAGGHDYGVNAVHDALVVRRGAVRIDGCERVGFDDALSHQFAGVRFRRQRGGRDDAACPRQPPIGQIREDAQVDPAARELLNQRRQRLACGVDHIGAIASRQS